MSFAVKYHISLKINVDNPPDVIRTDDH